MVIRAEFIAEILVSTLTKPDATTNEQRGTRGRVETGRHQTPGPYPYPFAGKTLNSGSEPIKPSFLDRRTTKNRLTPP